MLALSEKDQTVSNTPFKKCHVCSHEWNTVEDFLKDPATEILGYQASFTKLLPGLFLFNHRTCKNTVSFNIYDFAYLRNSLVFTENKGGNDGCPGHCLYKKKSSPCHNTCECRWVREVEKTIKGLESTF